jgi:hypothetical protein
MNTGYAIAAIYNMIWSCVVLGFTGYVVFWLGFSGWWFALAIFIWNEGQMEFEWKERKETRPAPKAEVTP